MISPSGRRLRPRIKKQSDLDRLYSFLPSSSPELSESESHATIRVNQVFDIQNPTSEEVSTTLTPQILTTTEGLKDSMGRSSSSGDAGIDASASSEAEPLAALLTADFINITVGPKRKTYCVHTTLLFNRCPWFEQREIYTSEGPISKSLYLKDVLPEPFELFVEWLYSGVIRSLGAEGKFFGGCGHGELYVLAGLWEMTEIQNLIMDCLLTWSREHNGRVDEVGICIIFDHTNSSSPLRQFVIRQSAHFLSTSDWAVDEDEWRKLINIGGDFGFGVMKALRDPSRRKIKSPGDQPNCDFHTHKVGDRCDRKK